MVENKFISQTRLLSMRYKFPDLGGKVLLGFSIRNSLEEIQTPWLRWQYDGLGLHN